MAVMIRVTAVLIRSIGTRLLVRWPGIQTFTYTKVINSETGMEDLPRVDFINAQPLPEELECQLVSMLERVAFDRDAARVHAPLA